MAAFTVPVPMLEMVLASSGTSEWIPAAAPPLGMTARLLVAGSAAFLGGGAAAALSARSLRDEDKHFEKRGRSMASAFSRLTAFARKGQPEAVTTEADAQTPHLRRADAHPDAPARAPIVASRDFGQGTTKDFTILSALLDGDEGDAPPGIVVDATGLDMPRAPEPMPWEAIKAEMERIGATMGAHKNRADAQGGAETPEPLPTISELAERLERGIARQRAAAEQNRAPIDAVALRTIAEQVGIPSIAPAPAAAMEEGGAAPASQDSDLQAALATLRGITAKAG